ncbi:unnamed protein product, partial [Cylindrotheca closterium]
FSWPSTTRSIFDGSNQLKQGCVEISYSNAINDLAYVFKRHSALSDMSSASANDNDATPPPGEIANPESDEETDNLADAFNSEGTEADSDAGNVGDTSDDVTEEHEAGAVVHHCEQDYEHNDTNSDDFRNGDAVAVAVVADGDFDEDDDKPLNSLKASKKKTHRTSDSASKKKITHPSKKRKHSGRVDGKNHEQHLLSNTARALLVDTVPTVPVQIGDNIVVRSFGQLNVSNTETFSTESALYPVGFSCDRYEYSPVHGRVIKLRCTILDGKRTKLQYGGPIFRVMWGQGVNEDVDQVEYPYDPEKKSSPLQGEEPLANTTSASPWRGMIVPINGMKARVRFENDLFYYGTIETVLEKSEDNKKRRKSAFEISIQYDDGSMEETTYPDPDISIVMPGYDDELDHDNIDLKELKGKPVHTAIGKSPLEAWGQVIQKLGLVDEFVVENGLKAMSTKMEDLKDDDVVESLKHENVEEENSQSAGSHGSKTGCEQLSEMNEDIDAEKLSPAEMELKVHVARLKENLKNQNGEDKTASMALADVRISLLGTLACNPFTNFEGSISHQESWIAAAVRKEKSKMASTGNKRKIVTAADIVQRNNSFFNPDIEALIEGLPGSDHFSTYKPLESRSGLSTISKSFIQEQQLLQIDDRKRSLSRAKFQKTKSSQDKEKERKRKKREDERDARKRQKLEEEEEKKKARAEERLLRLQVQVDERMFKEASFQREKVVLAMAKSFGKEMGRRRRAAEHVAAQKIGDGRSLGVPMDSDIGDLPPLPPLSKPFDEDVLRIWDFISTFGSFFLERGYVDKLPTLDALQSSIDVLRTSKTGQNRREAISFVTNLAIALCKPLSAGLTRMLFASLIALNPTLQKDFGAAFFNEQSATEVKGALQNSSQPKVLLPVNVLTWKEIARIAFLSDALGELGHSRQEQAHYLRGYRSTGHPNSKEARRLRRVEDFAIAVLRQSLVSKHQPEILSAEITQESRIRINVPSQPLCNLSSWLFQLHNILSLKTGTGRASYIKLLENALGQLQPPGVDGHSQAKPIHEVKKILTEARDGISKDEPFNLSTIIKKVFDLFEKYTFQVVDANPNSGGTRFNERVGSRQNRTQVPTQKYQKLSRSTMGALQSLALTPQGLKDLARVREKYMSDALVLKEQMKRQELKEAGDEDDDDDDEEEEIGHKETKTTVAVEISSEGKENGTSEKKGVSHEIFLESGDRFPGADMKQRIGKETPHDDFCCDIPDAPELIRRCLAVLRTLCQSGAAEPFIFPVDPQTNPGYYDMLLKPMCMREVGIQLQSAARDYHILEKERKIQFLENAVAHFARNIRLIGRNCLSYANAGPTVISAGGEMLRIFERLLLDWVLAPPDHLTSLHRLDDDMCVDPHPSDTEATVLLCDGCEGNFNVSRLDPPIIDIPKGDWYCPRCVDGRCWGDLDPRIGKTLHLEGSEESCKVTRCLFSHFEHTSPSLMYEVETEAGKIEMVGLEDVDAALSSAGESIPQIACLEAVAESVGYGNGIDIGLRHDLVPVLLNPNVSDGAAQVALSSSVFRDSIAAAGTLLVGDDREMTAGEWLRLLLLLTMKCASSDTMQNLASDMENKAAEAMNKSLESLTQIHDIAQVFPEVVQGGKTEGCGISDTDGEKCGSKNGVSNEAMTVSRIGTIPEVATITIDPNAVEVLESADINISLTPCNESPYSERDESHEVKDTLARKSSAILEKSQRHKSREDFIAASCIKKQLRSTFASFCEDTISEVIESTLVSDETSLSLSSSRCEDDICDFCRLPDTALGAHLVRVPNREEWSDRIAHACKSQRTFLIAELRSPNQSETGRKIRAQRHSLVAVTVRLGGEIVPDERDPNYHQDIVDSGMIEFLPRNVVGFQEELSFSYRASFPFVTGSMSAHECCAIAVHNARKLMVVEKHKQTESGLAERDTGSRCGRTLEIGSDTAGRSYWKFNADQGSLFVSHNVDSGSDKSKIGRWLRFADPESIASVIVCLKKDAITSYLKRLFPDARQLLQNAQIWTTILVTLLPAKTRSTKKGMKCW